MKSGPYSPSEKEHLETIARQVASAALTFEAGVAQLAKDLGRSQRGISLFLGRLVRMASGKKTERKRRGLPSQSADIIALIKTLSRERAHLVAQREKLQAKISGVEEKLSELKPRLFDAMGMAPELWGPVPSMDDAEEMAVIGEAAEA